MPIFEANGKLPDGTIRVFTVEAKDKKDAQIEFCNRFSTWARTEQMQSGNPVQPECQIDYRTIKRQAA